MKRNNKGINKQKKLKKIKILSKKVHTKLVRFNNKNQLKFFEVLILLVLAIVLGFLLGNSLIKKDSGKVKSSVVDTNLSRFIENYKYIVDNYYEDVDKIKLIDSAIAGMTESLDDPYSVYMDSSSASSFNINLNGQYKGLGLVITKENDTDYIQVIGILDNSPASKTGIEVNDYIKSINEKSSKEMTTSEFSNYVINNDDTDYDLVIIRNGEEISKKIEKDDITISSVSSKLLEEQDKKIGYIYISIFANNTTKQFFSELKKLEEKNIDYLIIDVRSNTGGHLSSVDAILSNLLTKKQVLYQLKKQDKVEKIYGSAKYNKRYKIVLLGNELSASASEVLISSLRENLNSEFIGKKTYGKGTVQELVNINKNVQYKITTKKWLTPKGNWINDTKGIQPDIEVEYEEQDNEYDSQLKRAINYIINAE